MEAQRTDFCEKCGEILAPFAWRCPVCGAPARGADRLNIRCDCGTNTVKRPGQKRPQTHGTLRQETAEKNQGKTSISQLIRSYFRGAVNFSGRCSPRDFWATLGLVLLALLVILLGADVEIFTLCLLASLLPTISLAARRLRDAGFPAVLVMLLLVPYVGALLLLILLCLPTRAASKC